MEFTHLTILFVVLFAVFENGAAIKCVQGVPGVSTTEVECAGSCIKTDTMVNGKKTYALACSETAQKDGCTKTGDSNVCFCSTNLCNKVDAAKPSGVSGLRAHTVPIAMCLSLFVAKLFYF